MRARCWHLLESPDSRMQVLSLSVAALAEEYGRWEGIRVLVEESSEPKDVCCAFSAGFAQARPALRRPRDSNVPD